MRAGLTIFWVAVATAAAVGSACFDNASDCTKRGNCPPPSCEAAAAIEKPDVRESWLEELGCEDVGASSSSGSGGSGAAGGGAGTGPGGEGGGGGEPCGGDCQGSAPHCDEGADICVACLNDSHCGVANAAKCDEGTCVPCDDSSQCLGISDAEVCNEGACVECALGDEGACDGGTTCDLVARTCVEVAAGSVQNCRACSNDLQCATGHRCIAMEFPEGTEHGYYCLREATTTCARPFQVGINRDSISGEPAVNYCGIEEELTTCEAVLALAGAWICPSETDGMCSPLEGEPEVAVPGAVCRDVDVGGKACTYECEATQQCPTGSPVNTCGDGEGGLTGWCGG